MRSEKNPSKIHFLLNLFSYSFHILGNKHPVFDSTASRSGCVVLSSLERRGLKSPTHQGEISAESAGHPEAPGCSPCYFLALPLLEGEKRGCKLDLLSHAPCSQHASAASVFCYEDKNNDSRRVAKTMKMVMMMMMIPGSCSSTWGRTLRSQGHTWQRISSVSRPPSLIAILLRADTSTGLTLRACLMSAIFLVRLDVNSFKRKTNK